MAKFDSPVQNCVIDSACFYTPAPKAGAHFESLEFEPTPFRALLDAMPDFIIYYDQDLKVLWANYAASADHGLTPEEMVGRSFFEVSCKLSEPCDGCPVIMGLHSNRAEAIENNPHVGRLFYTRTYPVFQNGKILPGRMFVAQDISNLKNRYSVTDILNRISELFHEEDQLPRICKKLIRLILSRFAYAYGVITLCGEHSDEIMAIGGTDLNGNFPTLDSLSVSRTFTGIVMENGESLNISGLSATNEYDQYYLKENGAETVLAVPLKIQGQIIGAIVLVDVIQRMETALTIERLGTIANRLAAEIHRKKTDERLREERNFTSAILNNAGPLIMVTDRHGHIVRFNKTCERLTGYDRKEVIGKYVWEIGMARNSRDKMRNMFPHAQDIDFPSSFENMIVTRTGERRLISWTNSIMADSIKTRIHIVSIGVDITEKKAAEEKAETRMRQLVEADKMVSMGILASEVAHEINNPNNFIALNAPILKKAWDDISGILKKYRDACGDFLIANVPYSEMSKEIPVLFEGIEAGSQRIRKIIKNMKNFARRDDQSSLQPVNLNDVIQAALTLVSTQIKNRTVIVLKRLLDPLPPVYGNFQRLEQVVVNLVLNALQALSGKDDRILIETEFDVENNLVLLCITDNGAGIHPDHIPRLSEPFFTTKSNSGGTGLGLSVCAAILKEHKGTLSFDSAVGQGTKVTFSLPAET